jgi:DNA-binding NarL/FixJ family response regulator
LSAGAAPAKGVEICVAIVEGDPLRAIGLRAQMDGELDVQVVCTDLEGLVVLDQVSVALVASHNESEIIELIAAIRERRPDVKILVVGSKTDEARILNVLLEGARGYVNETSSTATFVEAIRAMHGGSLWCPRRVLAKLIDRSQAWPSGANSRLCDLTAREKQVLSMLAQGRANKEIAGSLGIEERTVKAHLAKLMRKFGAQNRIALTMHALRHGLLAATGK